MPIWKTMSSAPADRAVLFKVPIGKSGFHDTFVGKFEVGRGWVHTVPEMITAPRIFPTGWCPIPEFDDEHLPRTPADEAARNRPLTRQEHER